MLMAVKNKLLFLSIFFVALVGDVVIIRVLYDVYRGFKYHLMRFTIAGAYKTSDRYDDRDKYDN